MTSDGKSSLGSGELKHYLVTNNRSMFLHVRLVDDELMYVEGY